jgi:hypothetical protein
VVSGAFVAAAIVVGVAWAHDVSAGSARSRARFFGAETTTTSSKNWCVPISRAAAIQAVGRWNVASSPPSPAAGNSVELVIGTAEAKLIRWSDWTNTPDPEHTNPSRWWLIETQGGPFHLGGKLVSWQLVWVNARTGEIRNESHGPGSPPSGWRTLTDHSANCSSR